MAKTAGIIVIGNEILSGKVVDTNSPYLCQELRALGVDVRRIVVVPDEIAVIAADVATFARTFDYAFTTGGVGPTHDDVTIEAIAHGLQRPVIVHPDLDALLQKHWADRPSAARQKMASVPQGAQLLMEPSLPIPVLLVENVYIFPVSRSSFDANSRASKNGSVTHPITPASSMSRSVRAAFPTSSTRWYTNFLS